ncbi:MAG: GlsB/YeaQ/YmgE family stress response membrane protein [Anaerolineaceae bacterium]|nr:GlsB/YeaQ/YmgE family stress response membrane protein [Anaerolineaceae bacterium]
MNFLWWIIVGGIAGWLASMVVKNVNVSVLGAIISGILGGGVGGFLFSLLGLGSKGLIGEILVSFVGAIVVLLIYRAIRK